MTKISSVRSVFIRFIVLSLAAAFLASCTSSIPAYQEMNWDGGYNSLPQGNDIHKVIFKGREGSDKVQVRDYALLRSAEISRDAGFKYFVVIKELAADWISKDQIPATPATRDTVQEVGATRDTVQEVGANGRFYNRTVTTPATRGYTLETLVPVCTLTIKMLQSAPENKNTAKTVFDATATIADIKAKYHLK